MEELRQRGYYYGSLLYVFLISFPQQLVNAAIILWTIFTLLNFKRLQRQRTKSLWLLPAFYFSYFLVVFHSDTDSYKFLEHKLSFLIFPLLFHLQTYRPSERKKMLQFFVLGLVLSGMICLGIAGFNSLSFEGGKFGFTPNVLEGKGFFEAVLYGGNYFFGKHLSIFHQTVYYALYLCSGIAILLFCPQIFSFKKKWGIISFLAFILFLVSNKASFIVLGMVFGLWFLTIKMDRYKRIYVFSIFVLGMLTMFLLNPRTGKSVSKIFNEGITLNQEARYGLETRLLSWDAAISLIRENPLLGYGYNNAQIALDGRYLQKGYIFPLKEHYNAHNLWLQTWLENGIVGEILLFSLFFAMLRKAIICWQQTPVLLVFTFIFLINSMFEGLFNRFSGVSFFAFIACFILTEIKKT